MRRLRRLWRKVGGAWVLRLTAALAALVMVTGLVLRFSATLTTLSPETRAAIAPDGELTLEHDTAAPLFDRVELRPDETAEACARVDTRSLTDPLPLRLTFEPPRGDPPLARHLIVQVDRGSGTATTGGGSCAGFTARHRVVRDTLANVGERHAEVKNGLVTDDPGPGETASWYRVRVTMSPDTPTDLQATTIEDLAFVWNGRAAGITEDPLNRSLSFLLSLAEQTTIPLVLILVATTFYLGIQNRIDRHDPKLADAPVEDDLLPFE